MNKRHYEHTLPNIRGSLSNTYGGTYSIWKDHINLIAELNDGKYFSGGIFFKLHLK